MHWPCSTGSSCYAVGLCAGVSNPFLARVSHTPCPPAALLSCVLQDDLCSFFNALMTCSGAQLDSGNSVINCSITRDKGPPYAFIKLRSVQEASNSLAFNGIQFRGHTLKVCSRRHCMHTQGPSVCVLVYVGLGASRALLQW
jgi:hypothetical protein